MRLIYRVSGDVLQPCSGSVNYREIPLIIITVDTEEFTCRDLRLLLFSRPALELAGYLLIRINQCGSSSLPGDRRGQTPRSP